MLQAFRRIKVFQILLALFSLGVIAFLLLPLIVVIPMSFNPGSVLRFPLERISFQWYQDFFDDPRWIRSVWLSLRLAISVSLLTTTLGLFSAIALTRFVKRGKGLIRTLLVAPLIFPVIVIGIAMFDVFNQVGLIRTFLGMVLAHTILATPYAVLTIESGLKRVNLELEDAAISLGASRIQAFMKITMPLITPSLIAAAVFSFVISWDEVVLVVFISGARDQTLPLRMFEFLQTEIRPTLAAISSMLILGLVCALAAAQLWQAITLRKRRIKPSTELDS